LTVRTGQLAAVSVERALYRGAGSRFYIHVRIDNRVGSPIWVPVSDYTQSIYPMQWERSQLDHREVIDELREPHIPLDRDRIREELLKGSMTRLQAAGRIDVYREFYGEAYQAVDAAPGRWVLVALDGRVLVTDGTRVDDLTVGEDEASRLLVVPAAPLVWQKLPTHARVIENPS
jgi:hypothetical protein